RYLIALAYQGQSNALPAKDPNRKKLAGIARQHVVPVARHPGEFQRPARMMLVALGGAKDSKDGDPTTFADAFERGKMALEKMQSATESLQSDDGKADAAAVAELRKEKQEQAAAALDALRLALERADSKTPIEDLNSARYYLCFLLYDGGQTYDAA